MWAMVADAISVERGPSSFVPPTARKVLLMPSIRNRLTYANVASTLCLTLVLGGGVAFAAGIPPNSVGSIQIKNGNVKTPDLKNNAVKSGKVKDGTLTGADVADGSLASLDILDDSLTADDLAANSVGQSEIATDGVAATEVQDNSIDSGEIVNNSLFAADLGASSVGSSELGTITQRSATSAAIAPGATGNVTVSCLVGEDVLSGGNDMSSQNMTVVASRRGGANGWTVFARNDTGVNQTTTVHAYCLAP